MALHALRARPRAGLLAGLVAVGLLGAAGPAPAAPQALLVGVSGYPSLPEARRLRGPRNDVPLMRDALQRAGMPHEGITLLADGVPGSAGLPTRSAILAALASLAARAAPGDWVVVYFSGHGSQQPQPPQPPGLPRAVGSARFAEPDGLDEIFLPYDIGRWDGHVGSVQGALLDDDIGTALAAISARGARVWAIFDTCHAGDMARAWRGAQPGTAYRTVPPEALGVPPARTARATAASRPTTVAPVLSRRAGAAPVPLTGTAVFYASHPDEPAAEEPLPDPDPGAGPWAGGPGAARPAGGSAAGPAASLRVYGYFTWSIAQELVQLAGHTGRPPSTLAALAQRVAQRYASRPYPTPLFEGDLTQVPDFFSRPALTSAPPPGPGHQAPPRTHASRTP